MYQTAMHAAMHVWLISSINLSNYDLFILFVDG